MKHSIYQDAEAFFSACKPLALTFDDVSLATRYSEVLPKETHLEVSLSKNLHLSIPIISADMDTVTESQLAIAMALQGGLGLIHYNMSYKDQIKEVARVKNHIHGLIQDPIKLSPNIYVADVLNLIKEKDYKFSTFPVVDSDDTLVGLLPSRVVKDRYGHIKVAQAMTPRKDILTLLEKDLGKNPVTIADKFFNENLGIHKLLIVDKKDKLKGLFTLSDVDSIREEEKSSLKSARDDSFRLVCGAAISSPRNSSGELNEDSMLEHVNALVQEGVDAIAISTAHGFTQGVQHAIKLVRKNFKDLTIIAGNVTSPEGVEFLAKAGANAIKVGQGPGSICTTRIVAGVGIPQLTALFEASKAANKWGVKILADGGITKSGDIVKALTLADAVICGGMFGGCKESPGTILEINGKYYKQYRGMGSLVAMQSGSAARYGHDSKTRLDKSVSEGIEALKEVSGSVADVLSKLIGGLRIGMGYLGAKNLNDLKENARYVQVTQSGQKESAPHDIIELKTTQEN